MSVIDTEQVRYENLPYHSPQDALERLLSLSLTVREQMAQVYKDAFGGYPWYEVYQCTGCGNYSPTDENCAHCQGTEFSDAYHIEELMNKYFPEMLQAYLPGVLILAKDGEDSIEGFSTGGGTTFGTLVEKKYKGDQRILASIRAQTGLTPETPVFYENETCISPESQQAGIGSSLNYQRLESAVAQGFKYICGRSVNKPWLGIKRSQMEALGYDFQMFVPEGDTYEVGGSPRYFFMGVKRDAE